MGKLGWTKQKFREGSRTVRGYERPVEGGPPGPYNMSNRGKLLGAWHRGTRGMSHSRGGGVWCRGKVRRGAAPAQGWCMPRHATPATPRWPRLQCVLARLLSSVAPRSPRRPTCFVAASLAAHRHAGRRLLRFLPRSAWIPRPAFSIDEPRSGTRRRPLGSFRFAISRPFRPSRSNRRFIVRVAARCFRPRPVDSVRTLSWTSRST